MEKKIWLKSTDGDFKSYKIEKLIINTHKSILKLSSIDDRNAAESLRGFKVYLSRSDFLPLSDGEFYISDIIGFKVYDEQKDFLGVVDDVLSVNNKDIMVVNMDNNEC